MTKRALKKISIIIVFAIGLICFLKSFLVIDFYPNSSGLSQNYSRDLDSVEFFIYSPKSGRTDLCVPEAYFGYSKDIRRGVKSHIKLVLDYPTLLPWNIYESEFFESHPGHESWSREKIREHQSRKSYLDLHPGYGGKYIQDIRSREFYQLENGVVVKPLGEFEQLEDDFWQFKHARQKGSFPERFLSPEPKDFSLIITCNTNVSCTLETYVTDKMTMIFNFSRNHLVNWRKVKDDIVQFSKEFICMKE